MIEKTIFVVKPIYIPVQVPVTEKKEAVLVGKKQLKLTRKQQKTIYMERQKPPNYNAVAEERKKAKAGKSKKRA